MVQHEFGCENGGECDFGLFKTQYAAAAVPALSAYIQSTGKEYADHTATLRIWAKRQKAEKKTTPGIPDYTFAEGESL